LRARRPPYPQVDSCFQHPVDSISQFFPSNPMIFLW
jgi:hypothetical protein